MICQGIFHNFLKNYENKSGISIGFYHQEILYIENGKKSSLNMPAYQKGDTRWKTINGNQEQTLHWKLQKA